VAPALRTRSWRRDPGRQRHRLPVLADRHPRGHDGRDVLDIGTTNGAGAFEPDVASIDVDGADYWIWAAMESIRPRVLVIECNTALDPQRRLVQPDDPAAAWRGTDYYGASVGALAALGAGKGYQLVHVDLAGVNAFFVRSEQPLGWPDEVPRRGANLWLSSVGHPPDPTGRRYLDLDAR
jgi:hypothetical protein